MPLHFATQITFSLCHLVGARRGHRGHSSTKMSTCSTRASTRMSRATAMTNVSIESSCESSCDAWGRPVVRENEYNRQRMVSPLTVIPRIHCILRFVERLGGWKFHLAAPTKGDKVDGPTRRRGLSVTLGSRMISSHLVTTLHRWGSSHSEHKKQSSNPRRGEQAC